MLKSTGPAPSPAETPKVKKQLMRNYEERTGGDREQAPTRASNFTDQMQAEMSSRNDISGAKAKLHS